MTFISQLDSAGWIDRIRRFRHGVSKTAHAAGSEEDRTEILREIARTNPSVVVTDSADLDEEYLALLSTRVPLLISFDELATTRFPSDLVINPTLGHSTADFSLYPGTQLVAGNKYTMIRSEFRRARNVRATEPGGPARILLSLSGGECAAETVAYAGALLKGKVAEKIDAVLGTSKQGKEAFEALSAEFPDAITVVSDARDMATRMTKAHLLITGGGNTPLEAACVGVPMLIVSRQESHHVNATWLEEIGVAQYLGSADKVTPDEVAKAAAMVLEDNFERKAMSRSGRMLIDGRGADRIVTATEILLRRSRRVKALAAA